MRRQNPPHAPTPGSQPRARQHHHPYRRPALSPTYPALVRRDISRPPGPDYSAPASPSLYLPRPTRRPRPSLAVPTPARQTVPSRDAPDVPALALPALPDVPSQATPDRARLPVPCRSLPDSPILGPPRPRPTNQPTPIQAPSDSPSRPIPCPTSHARPRPALPTRRPCPTYPTIQADPFRSRPTSQSIPPPARRSAPPQSRPTPLAPPRRPCLTSLFRLTAPLPTTHACPSRPLPTSPPLRLDISAHWHNLIY